MASQQNRALNEFWWHVSQDLRTDIRYEWLRKLAALRVRPVDGWSYWRERKAWGKSKRKRIRKIQRNTCFLCQTRAECEHHIIQAQHGGTNAKRNRVFLCKTCHQRIHPWM